MNKTFPFYCGAAGCGASAVFGLASLLGGASGRFSGGSARHRHHCAVGARTEDGCGPHEFMQRRERRKVPSLDGMSWPAWVTVTSPRGVRRRCVRDVL